MLTDFYATYENELQGIHDMNERLQEISHLFFLMIFSLNRNFYISYINICEDFQQSICMYSE